MRDTVRLREEEMCSRSQYTGCSGRNGGAVVALVLLRVLLEDLRLGGVGRHAQDLCRLPSKSQIKKKKERGKHRLVGGTATVARAWAMGCCNFKKAVTTRATIGAHTARRGVCTAVVYVPAQRIRNSGFRRQQPLAREEGGTTATRDVLGQSEKVAGLLQSEGRSMARVTLILNPSAGSSRSLTSTHMHSLLAATTCLSPAQQSGVGARAVALSCTNVRHVASPISRSAHMARSWAKSARATPAHDTASTAATITSAVAAAAATPPRAKEAAMASVVVLCASTYAVAIDRACC